MTTTRRRVAPLLLAMSFVCAPPVAGQASIGADAGVFSQYVWRGITFTSDPAVQPDVWASVGGLAVGVWGNLEISNSDLSLRGLDNAGFGEIDYFADYSHSLPMVDLAIGGIHYTFLGVPGSGDGNTTEVYASASLSGLPISPSLAAFYDVGKVKGLYVEGGFAYTIPLAPTVGLDIGVLAGFSAGQEVNAGDPTENANFAESGLTHVDFSAGMELAAGVLSISPVVHVLVNVDENTKVTGLLANQLDVETKVWFGVSLGWSQEFSASR